MLVEEERDSNLHIFPFANSEEAFLLLFRFVAVAFLCALTKNAFANKFLIFPISVYLSFISRAFCKLNNFLCCSCLLPRSVNRRMLCFALLNFAKDLRYFFCSSASLLEGSGEDGIIKSYKQRKFSKAISTLERT